MKPLFMWAGGKNKLIKIYDKRKLLPETFDTYIEPFLGGGAMFIWAYEKNPNANFVLNDSNPYIMGIYNAVKNDFDEFCRVVFEHEKKYLSLYPPKKQITDSNGKKIWVDHPIGCANKELEKRYKEDSNVRWIDLWNENPIYHVRRTYYFKTRQEYQKTQGDRLNTFYSATLYFLMKTGFNGVWQTYKERLPEPPGKWKKHDKRTRDTGLFHTPCGLMRHEDSIFSSRNGDGREDLKLWNRALQNATLLNLDFMDTLDYAHGEENCFIFMDPPYRGCFTQYGVDFDDKLQQSVVDYLNCATHGGAYVMMSNRDVGDGFFEQRQGTNIIETFDVTYTVGRRKKEDDGTYSAKKAKEILMIGKK